MEPARPGVRRPTGPKSAMRLRRGSIERPVDLRLVRNLGVLVVAGLLLVVVTVARPGPLPAATLPPAFDGATAADLAVDLATNHASRVPGTLEADRAADWFREKLSLYGLAVQDDVWSEDVPGLGRSRLRNLALVVEGTLDETIVVVAHRDNDGLSAGANDNASGTAALVELARAYATAGTTASSRTPLHTLVFLSTDAGAYGARGAARFAATSALAERAVAVVALDGLAGRTRVRLELSGLGRRSPPPALVRTAAARVATELGAEPVQPGVLAQLVSLGLPFAFGEQAPFLGGGVPSLRITTSADGGVPPGTDELQGIDATRFERLGRASESLLAALDTAVEAPSGTAGTLYLADRGIRGWALQLLLLAAVVPFAGAALDLLSRCRRRRLRLLPAWRALRRRVGLALGLVVLVALAALAGALPREPALPPPPDEPPVDSWPVAAIAIGVVCAFAVWVRGRTRLGRPESTPETELAAYAVAYVALVGLAAGVALVSPFGLVFVLPSLYAWLVLPQLRRAPGWVSDLTFGLGFLGPVLALVVVGEQLDLGPRAPLYVLSLMTTGVVPWASTLLLAVWVAIAAFVGSIVADRYAEPAATSGR